MQSLIKKVMEGKSYGWLWKRMVHQKLLQMSLMNTIYLHMLELILKKFYKTLLAKCINILLSRCGTLLRCKMLSQTTGDLKYWLIFQDSLCLILLCSSVCTFQDISIIIRIICNMPWIKEKPIIFIGNKFIQTIKEFIGD